MAAADRALVIAPLLRHFPAVTHAFAYGSGVMHQPGLYPGAEPQAALPPTGPPPTSKGPMLDLMFSVPNARDWHQRNIALNPSHYSWLARSPRFGHDIVAGIAEYIGVGVHFNTLVPLEGRVVKYGVVEDHRLRGELQGWQHMFVAGRMHKPVLTLKSCPHVEAAQAHNLRSALAAALLLLPPSFSTDALMRGICALSYNGDVRMGLAEDPHKVERIASGSRQVLADMYLPLMRGRATAPAPAPAPAPVAPPSLSSASAPQLMPHTSTSTSTRGRGLPDLALGSDSDVLRCVTSSVAGAEGRWQQDMSYGARLALVRTLPVGLLHEASRRLGLLVPESHLQMKDTMEEISALMVAQENPNHPLHYQRLVATSLASIVRRSSTAQAVAGALAAGGGKSLEYLVHKVRKASWARQLLGLKQAQKPPGSGAQ